ncbi:hypothetical protein Tco_0627543 [Tanacetum coccineum]|uniref:Uncharacterized protein n=1 Tax=Tanacetum coccineum TaxID=301880 RepID=A0ABQ4WNJ6_9ASTR
MIFQRYISNSKVTSQSSKGANDPSPLTSFYRDEGQEVKSKLNTMTVVKSKEKTKSYNHIHNKYEWNAPRCGTCLIYGHSFKSYSKAVKVEIHLQTLNEEDKVFEDVGNSNAKNDGYVVTDATKVGEDIDNDVEDVFHVTAQSMTSPSKRAGGSGGANEAGFSEDEDYDMYDGYEDCADDLTEEHKTFYQAWDINFRSKVER